VRRNINGIQRKEAIMLFADYENVEGQLATYRVVNAFVGKVLARLRGFNDGHLTSSHA
jgi:hypothetical protein